jgi:restriction system protein
MLSILAGMLVADQIPGRSSAGRTISALDDWLTRSVGRLGMSSALLLGAVIYGAVGLALPLSVGGGDVALVGWNALGVLLGWTVTVAWVFSQVQAANRRHLLEWTTNLRLLSAQEFEWIVGEVLRREGWDVEETGREAAADGNVDLRIRRGEQESLVQCKRWQSWPVGVDEVRKLAGTLMREGLRGADGIFVTLSHFTDPAIAEASKLGIELVDNQELVRRIEDVRTSEPCPVCATPMLLDRSARGWWLRCPAWADGCVGKRDLSGHPGRALELLLAD